MADSGIPSWFPKILTQAVTAIAPGCIPLLAGAVGTVALPVAAGVACLGAVVWLTRWESDLQDEEANTQLREYFQYLLQTQAKSKDEIFAAIKTYAGEIPQSLPLDEEAAERLVSLAQAVQELQDKPNLDEAGLVAAVEHLIADNADAQGLVAKSLLEIKDRFDGVDQALAEVHADLHKAVDEIKGLVSSEHEQTRDHLDQAAERLEGGIQSTPQAVVDAWKRLELAPMLVVPCLIGGWVDSNEHDGAVIDHLLDAERAQFDAVMREAVQLPDAPIVHRDGNWTIPDRVGLWRAIGSRVFDHHLDRLCEAAEKVFGERNPAFDLPEDQRWMANLKGKVLLHSCRLREGLIHTLALLGSYPAELVNCTHEKPQDIAFIAIRKMLTDADWQRWGSLDRLLPTLAEASPEAFLEAIENALRNDPCPFDQLFAEEGNGITGGCHLTGLLWALEKLAWHADYLVRVASILGDLNARDPGGTWVNRPGNSLTTILCPWLPQTAAPIAKHAVAIRAVLMDTPQKGWELLLKLLPGDGAIQTYTQRPTYRQWDVYDESWRPLRQDVATAYRQYSAIAAEVAQGDPVKLTDLMLDLGNLAEEDAKVIVEHLLSEAADHFSKQGRLVLWEAVTKTLRHHDRSPDADWRWPDEVLDQLREIDKRLTPDDPVDRYRFLFVTQTHQLYTGLGDYAKQEQDLRDRRAAAVQEVLQHGGIEAVLNLARHSERAIEVGFACGRLDMLQDIEELLLEWVGSNEGQVSEFARGLVMAGSDAGGWAWLDSLGIPEWPVQQRITLLSWLSFTPETWERADRWLGDESAKYWEACQVTPYAKDVDFMPAVDRLRRYGRPMQSLDCLHQMIDKDWFDADVIMDALLEAASSDEEHLEQFSYHVEELIKRLQSSDSTDASRLQAVEWTYLPMFPHHDGVTPASLENALARDSDFFCELICIMFKPSNQDHSDREVPEEVKEGLATRTFRLFQDWSTPPGMLEDGSFDATACAAWFDAARVKLEASFRLETGLHTVGQVLLHVPEDPGGLWLHRGAAAVLNRADMAELRRGFELGAISSRGMYWVNPTGANEEKLADEWHKKADEVEDAGFHRLAVTCRDVSDTYRREAEKVRRRHEAREQD